MNLNSISAFQDNYIWILSEHDGRCLIVDPGEAAPVIAAVERNHWQPQAILLTHHHHDHVGGVRELKEKYPQLTVYGPEETRSKGATHIVSDGDKVSVSGCEFSVFATPGHTLGHVCYVSHPYLFCGDTLFSGGCGRLFEGTAQQMYQSLKKIAALPDDTLVCCAHEYTLSNMEFTVTLLPDDPVINDYYSEVKQLRAKDQSTLPVTLQKERRINLFLRSDNTDLFDKISEETNLQQPEQRFAWLRSKKDDF